MPARTRNGGKLFRKIFLTKATPPVNVVVMTKTFPAALFRHAGLLRPRLRASYWQQADAALSAQKISQRFCALPKSSQSSLIF
jgi:hypothetical protein